MDLTTILIASAILLLLYVFLRKPDPRLPPFPSRPLPLLGNILSLEPDFRPQFWKLREKFGDIFSLYMGGTLVVVLNGYDVIKEALVKKADVFSDRPSFFGDLATGLPGKGVIFSSGALWKEQRSVSLSILRAFGMGKNLLAEKIQEEVDYFIQYLSSLKEKPADIRIMTNVSTSNIICSILIGHRFEYDDKHFQSMMHKLAVLATDQNFTALVQFLSWLQYIPGDFFKAKKITASARDIIEMLALILNQKKRNVQDSSDVGNLIDAYITERQKKLDAGVSTTLDDQNLLKIMFDLFGAGTETTSTTIYWCILYILHSPEVQKKIYREIKDNIGTDRTPTIQDKVHLIYLNAVIMETQRLASIVALSVAHACSEEVTLRGYTIPKGTLILPNLDSVLHDKATWGEDAMSFRPERFIDNDGKLKNPEQFIPFSIGRRACLGESLAKMELFLFLANMFQRFEFLPASPGRLPPTDYKVAVVMTPKHYEVRAVERK
ncbi:unnamed protein product [Candidula unifasciata]|uniref:Cytochrome P450 n=1 Tax=Candidula unifasciata TaxID=100452 RepID=A0A8S3YDI2_9EUPU|nr:unnamed protein product [Candidula unifasciata]